MRITHNKLKEILAEQIGVEPEDISDEDSLVEDLHMTNADITDLAHKLEGAGAQMSEVDFSVIDTVLELSEALGLLP